MYYEIIQKCLGLKGYKKETKIFDDELQETKKKRNKKANARTQERINTCEYKETQKHNGLR
jgi:Sec-independent protein translocase protein TatA